MKRIAIILVVLGICVWSWGHDKPAAQNPPAGQGASQTAAPQGKRPPKINSQEEYAAYQAAVKVADPAECEKAANDFAAKYPASEVRTIVYKAAMLRNQ